MNDLHIIPALYLFPVPMASNGNISSVLPARNIELLHYVSHFIVENIRSARRFIKACDPKINIDYLKFYELNRHTDSRDLDAMIEPLTKGEAVGVISEAGCPAIADPGADIVAIAQRKGYRVIPLVGPSSIIMSLMGSGFNGQNFAFNGYLPIDSHERLIKGKEMERRIRKEHQTQIFIETPYRNHKMIEWLCDNMSGDLLLCVASDITGPNESIVTLPLYKWKNKRYNYEKIPSIFLLYF